jgi:hypothetical protein
MNSKISRFAAEAIVPPVYVVGTGEVLLEAPRKKVWPHIIHYTTWQAYTITEHISGKAGEEGEVVLLKKDDGTGIVTPAYYARTVRIEPERRIIWKTFTDNGDQEINFSGVVDFRLQETNGTTAFWYNFVSEYLVPNKNERELAEFRDQQYANFAEVSKVIFPKLKSLVERQA